MIGPLVLLLSVVTVPGDRVTTSQSPIANGVRAAIDSGRYDQAEATARLLVANTGAAYGAESPQAAVASDLLVEALLRNGRDPDVIRVQAERTLRIRERRLGTQHAELVPTLLNLGEVLIEDGEYPRASTVIERAVVLEEKQSGPSSVPVARALDTLGLAHMHGGAYDLALRALDRSLRIKEARLAAGDVEIARTLAATGWTLQRSGAYDRAGPLIRRALAIQEAADVSHPAYVGLLNVLGLQLWFEGDLASARVTAERAVAAAERTLRPGHPDLARSLNNAAVAAADLGDVEWARSAQERALRIAEANYGATNYHVAGYVSDLASLNLLAGTYLSARALFERSLSIRLKKFGEWHQEVATVAHNLAVVDASLGDYPSARRQHSRAIAIWQRMLGRDHPFVATALTELATTLREQGSPAEAQPLLERALSIRERSLGAEHRDVARTLVDLALAQSELGRRDSAEALATRALWIWDRTTTTTPDSPDLATALELYAELQAGRGAAAAARQYYNRTLAIRKKIFGASHPLVARAQAGLALAQANLGDRAAAVTTAVDAERTAREHLRLMLLNLPERQSLNYAANRPKGLELLLTIAGAPEHTTLALDAVVKSRGLIVDEMAARRRAAAAERRPELAALWSTLVSARQRLANLVVRTPNGTPRADQYLALVDTARLEKERAERALAERSSEFQEEMARGEIGQEQIRSALPPQSALISFVRYDRPVLSRTPAIREPLATAHYLAFVLNEQGATIVQLGQAGALEALIARWRREAGGRPGDASAASAETAYRAVGAQLRARTWDLLKPHVADATRVFVVPDGALNLVNLAALPVGRTDYVIDRGPVIHYLSAERDLVGRRANSRAVGGLFALGGPAFDNQNVFALVAKPIAPSAVPVGGTSAPPAGTRSGCGTFQTLRFGPLPGTAAEATEIADLWREGTAQRTLARADVRLSLANDATEEAFRRQAPGRRVLHLATHGFFLGGACEAAASPRRGVGGVMSGTRAATPAAVLENPLLLSGLAFAGANHRANAAPDQDDGILTAEEIASIDLEGTEWAVLSACDTGLGEVKNGEGVFGLRRAFQIAGVDTVIMSLWSVEDQAARRWMRALYEARRLKNLDTADSVRIASLAILNERRNARQTTHPFYWAAFIGAGDWH